MGLFPQHDKMVYTRFAETGRVALVQDGAKSDGKLVAILDFVDQNRVLVDGPGQRRSAQLLKNLRLTDMIVEVKRDSKHAVVESTFTEAGIADKWAKSAWAKKRATRARRAELNDFERFQVFVHKKKRNQAIRRAVNKK